MSVIIIIISIYLLMRIDGTKSVLPRKVIGLL